MDYTLAGGRRAQNAPKPFEGMEGTPTPTNRDPIPTSNFAVVVVRNKQNLFLAVKESRNRGWWLPAGRVEPGETFERAAHRETLEEAGIKIELKGILRVEHTVSPKHNRLRVVYYAEPIDDSPPKSIPDEESEEARWVTLEELNKFSFTAPGLRGDELVEWGRYLEEGGTIYPLSVFAPERERVNAKKPDEEPKKRGFPPFLKKK